MCHSYAVNGYLLFVNSDVVLQVAWDKDKPAGYKVIHPGLYPTSIYENIGDFQDHLVVQLSVPCAYSWYRQAC